MAQQQSHVPKFGNWDSGNVPYTAYFENARKEKVSGVKIMNPNDPEENPEAFMFGLGGAGSVDNVSSAVQAPMSPIHVDSEKLMLAEEHHIEGHQQHSNHQWNTSDHINSGSHKHMTSECEIDNKNSGTRPKQEKSITEVNSNFSPLSPGPDRRGSGMNPPDHISYRSVALPKFGAWDEKDTASGVGFTVIFNKVKEKKQIAAARFPPVPPQPNNHSNNREKKTGLKICCCLLSRRSN